MNDAAALDTRYQYNGKELNDDFGLNWNDYGARWYDATVGRWWSVDPLAEKYSRWSGYCYGADNPIKFIDPNGLLIILAGTAELQQKLSSTLNTYLGIKDVFSIGTAGTLNVGSLTKEQLANLNATQVGMYNEIFNIANSSHLRTEFNLIDENTPNPKSDFGFTGKNYIIDAYDDSVLDVGDLSMLGDDIGNIFVHAIYEQTLGDNPVMTNRKRLQYDDAHKKTMENDKKKTGYTFANYISAEVDGQEVFVRDAINKDGNILKSTKMTVKSNKDMTIIRYENFDRYSKEGQAFLKEYGFKNEE